MLHKRHRIPKVVVEKPAKARRLVKLVLQMKAHRVLKLAQPPLVPKPACPPRPKPKQRAPVVFVQVARGVGRRLKAA